MTPQLAFQCQKTLVLDQIHRLDVLDQLIAKDVKDVTSWQWQKQLRTYYDSDRVEGDVKSAAVRTTATAVGAPIVTLKMVDAVLEYSFEYQGNAARLVHTPLTDKCYLTLTQGLSLGYGGNPYGPAGTGKTESVKALGASLGRQVLVFNCDEAIDFTSMGRILSGIVKCGAWGCFDEFNRLREDQLSAISQQIQVCTQVEVASIYNL
jgi:dynein heavy chain 2